MTVVVAVTQVTVEEMAVETTKRISFLSDVSFHILLIEKFSAAIWTMYELRIWYLSILYEVGVHKKLVEDCKLIYEIMFKLL